MAKYRKKPVIIDAWPCADLIDSARIAWPDLPREIVVAYEKGDIIFLPDGLSIKTLEGRMKANKDDMVLMGIEGEFYPCKPGIFADTYEEVKDLHIADVCITNTIDSKKILEFMSLNADTIKKMLR